MLEGVIGENGHHIGCADTIVCAERRITCRHPLAIDVGIDRVLGEVMLDVAILLGHHVDVGLQGHHGASFEARSSRLADEYIARSIMLSLEVQTLCQSKEVLLDRLSVERRAGDLCEIIEVAPHVSRRQGLDFSSHSRFVLKMNNG